MQVKAVSQQPHSGYSGARTATYQGKTEKYPTDNDTSRTASFRSVLRNIMMVDKKRTVVQSDGYFKP